MTYSASVTAKNWSLHKPFKISRNVCTHNETVICEVTDGSVVGRGEAAGVSYSGETQASMLRQINSIAGAIASGISRKELQRLLPAGGARNAVDCALWDLQAKLSRQTIWQTLGCQPKPVTTAFTVGIDTIEKMQQDAAQHSKYPIIKVKVDADAPLRQVAAVRAGAPAAAIIIDANQAWTLGELQRYAEPLQELGVEMIEQPLSTSDDAALRDYACPLPLCADESCATTADLDRLSGLYSMINIKLDKTGGLTEALALAARAETMGFELMVGNMLGSSLAMAPAFVIAQRCRYVDIDGPLLQAEDCKHPMHYEHGQVEVFTPALWG